MNSKNKGLPRFIIVLLVSLMFLTPKATFPQNELINHRVFLVSNIVDIKDNELFASRLNEIFSKQKESFTLIVNGDLVNSKFEKNYHKDSVRIFNLLTFLSKFKNGKTFIIPGERDWDDSKKNGLKNVKKLEDLIKSFELDNVKWGPKNGCPGPKEYDLNENLMLITINTSMVESSI